MQEPIQTYIRRLDSEVRKIDRVIDDLETRAYREKIGGKLQVYREIGFFRRRRDEIDRRLQMLRAAPQDDPALTTHC